MKRAIVIGTVLIVSLIFPLIWLELLLSRYYPIVGFHADMSAYRFRSDLLRYEPRPGGQFNTDGIRADHEYDIAKPDGIYRIVVIGDSLAYGKGVQTKDTFPSLLEQSLNAQCENQFEVLNLGVIGYDIAQNTLRLQNKGLKYDPDLIIYHHWLDDVHVSDPGWTSASTNPLLRRVQVAQDRVIAGNASVIDHGIANIPETHTGRLAVQMLRNSVSQRFKKNSLESETLMASLRPNVVDRYKTYVANYQNEDFVDLSRFENYYAAFANDVNFLYWNHWMHTYADTCNDASGDCLILLTPVLYPYTVNDYNWAALHTFIEDIARQYGVATLDVTSKLAGYSKRELRVTPQDPEHPSALGNTLIAENVMTSIVDTSDVCNEIAK